MRGQILTFSGPLNVPLDAHSGELGLSSVRFRPSCSPYCRTRSTARAVERVLVFEMSFFALERARL